jgi:uncharacterized protein YndB with AHSA1/START domain
MPELLPPIYWKVYIDCCVDRVYRALTTAEGWDEWFTKGADFDAREGGTILMRWADAVGLQHRVTLWSAAHAELEVGGPVIAVDPNRRFAFRWCTAGHPTTVDLRLEGRGAGTVVTVTEDGYTAEDLSATGVLGQMECRSPYAMCASGWGEALALLKFHLERGATYGSVPPT